MPGPQAPPRIPLSELKSATNPNKKEVTHALTPVVVFEPSTKPKNPEVNALRNNSRLAQRNEKGRPLFFRVDSSTIVPIKYLTSNDEIDHLNIPIYSKAALKDGKKVVGSITYVPPNYKGRLDSDLHLPAGYGESSAAGAAAPSSQGGRRKHKDRITKRRRNTKRTRKNRR